VWGTAPDFIGPRHELRESILLRALLDARPGSRILDVGAGQGTFTRRLSALGFDVTSTDLSEAAIGVLRERTGVTVVHADATSLPFDAASFDAVVLGEVLEHLDGDDAALREARRVLAPAGVVAISVPRNPAWFSRSDEWAGHVRRYMREPLVALVESAGFDVLECLPWGFPISALYHRTAYELAVRRGVANETVAGRGPALALLGALLRIDRLFIGVERGALGYVLVGQATVS
jgi:SAM-dependent methyltransferase